MGNQYTRGMKYDYLIVGAGIFGSVFGNLMHEAGKTCLVIDRRSHIAGNCYTEEQDGIDVHMYGPHLFHTSNARIWNYVNRFATFNGYRHTVQTTLEDDSVVSMPISLLTLNQLFNISTPAQALRYFNRVREDVVGNDVESWCLRNIGRELYELLVKGYTQKQWNCDPKLLPESIIKRLPLRLNYDNQYFNDTYQGIPIGGYTGMINRMLTGIPVMLGVDFLDQTELLKGMAKKVVYSGSPDELFGYDMGKLPYRSIRLEHIRHDVPDYQGTGQMNYASTNVPWTRITEHKHFTKAKTNHTIISVERSVSNGEPYYPINTVENDALAQQYIRRAEDEGYIMGGRMSTFRYLDMHQAVGMAMSMVEKELKQ